MAKSLYSLVAFLVLAGLLGLLDAQANQTCVPGTFKAVSNFSTERFSGTWYIWKFVAHIPEGVYPLDYSCMEVDFRKDDSAPTFPLIIHGKYVNLTDGNQSQSRTSYVMIDNNDDRGTWKVFGFPVSGGAREHNIVNVHTDYDSWAIQYECSVIDHFRYEDMSYLTRSRTPSKELISILDALTENVGYPLENSMQVDHTNC